MLITACGTRPAELANDEHAAFSAGIFELSGGSCRTRQSDDG